MFTYLKYFSTLTCLLCVTGAVKITIVRRQDGDVFRNPYAKGISDNDATFCTNVNSNCHRGYPTPRDMCTHCFCNKAKETTFDVKQLACVKNDDLRQGCSLRFRSKPDILNSVDLSESGWNDITILNMDKHLKFKRCWLKNEEQMTSTGYVTRTGTNLFYVCDKVHKDKFWLCWDKLKDLVLAGAQGKVYRIIFGCSMEEDKHDHKRKKVKYTAEYRLVIKTSGTTSVDYFGFSSSRAVPSLSTVSPPTSTEVDYPDPPSSRVIPSSTTSSLLPPTPSTTITHERSTSTRHNPEVSSTRSSTSTYSRIQSTPCYSSSVRSSSVSSTTRHCLLTSSRVEQERTREKVPKSTPKLEETEIEETVVKTVRQTVEKTRSATSPTSSFSESGALGNNEEQSSDKSDNVVVSVSVTLGIIVLLATVAGLLWFLVFSKRIAKKKQAQTSKDVAMQNLEHVYDGIYGYNQDEEETKRDKNGGIENATFGDNKNMYSSLGECNEEEATYQALIMAAQTKKTADKIDNRNTMEKQRQSLKANDAYDYAVNNQYACLSKDVPEQSNTYQALNPVGRDTAKRIPAQKNIHSSDKTESNNQPAAVSEPLYHTVEDGGADNVYSVLDGSDPSVYEAPDQTSNGQDDYVVILPEKSI